jgi:hypothetical protein
MAEKTELTLVQRHPFFVRSLTGTASSIKAHWGWALIYTLAGIPFSYFFGVITKPTLWPTVIAALVFYGVGLLALFLYHLVRAPLSALAGLSERVNELETRSTLEVVTSPTSTRDIERVMEQFMERFYDLKKLHSNLVESAAEPVPAHYDTNGVMVKGHSPNNGDTFQALVLPYTNSSHKEKVAPLEKVSLRITYLYYEGGYRPLIIPRGAWLSERETEVDFPPNCLPRTAIIAVVTGEMNTVNAIRRDDSTYKGVIYTPEELRGTVLGVNVDLSAPSHVGPVKKSTYILEIFREPSFGLRLTPAPAWKSEHLGKFRDEGYDFLTKIHEIWKDTQAQVPFPPVDTNRPIFYNYALSGSDQPEPFDYAAANARIRAIEQEQEGKLLDTIKDWESRAAGFVKLYIGTEQHDQFINSAPSIDQGFNRAEKLSRRFKILPRNASSPPELTYWTLYDYVKARTDSLKNFSEQIWLKHLRG